MSEYYDITCVLHLIHLNDRDRIYLSELLMKLGKKDFLVTVSKFIFNAMINILQWHINLLKNITRICCYKFYILQTIFRQMEK